MHGTRWLIVGVWCAGCTSSSRPTDPETAAYRRLGDAVRALTYGDDPSGLPLPERATLAVDNGGFTIRFGRPIDAGRLAAAWGWSAPYAISDDVHLASWELVLADTPPGDARDLETTRGRLGTWTVEVDLEARPPCSRPTRWAEDSPALPLDVCPTNAIQAIFR